jgi:catechol 2,3-dioxygenase-like lactoylglutathione lyase family enzyme
MSVARYMVRDVAEAVDFYTGRLGFRAVETFGAAMAIVEAGGTTLWLAGPGSSAARPMPDGRRPEPGGWNRIVVEVADLEARVADLRAAGVVFRNEIVRGPGGAQILCEDPSGNPIELFAPRR